jgi:tetratricopeptide (TPR) repeat protein
MNMCNGSKASKLRRLRNGSARRAQLWLALGLSCVSVGCQQDALRAQADLRQAMSAVNAEQLYEEGVLHARLGDSLRAEQYLTAARALGYDEGEVVSWLVRICVSSNRYQSALAHAEPYLRRHPEDWPLRFVVANLYDALGDTERAGLELEAVTEAAPDEPFAQYRLGVFYSERSLEAEEARRAFENYLRLDPGGRYAAEARTRLQREDWAANGPRRVSSAAPYPQDEALP